MIELSQGDLVLMRLDVKSIEEKNQRHVAWRTGDDHEGTGCVG